MTPKFTSVENLEDLREVSRFLSNKRFCTACQLDKPKEEFIRLTTKSGIVRYVCGDCQKRRSVPFFRRSK